jgi:hypothetical protein
MGKRHSDTYIALRRCVRCKADRRVQVTHTGEGVRITCEVCDIPRLLPYVPVHS